MRERFRKEKLQEYMQQIEYMRQVEEDNRKFQQEAMEAEMQEMQEEQRLWEIENS